MKLILDAYYRLLKLVLTFLMFALVVPVTMQIISRYTGVIPRYIWTEEISRFCFVWIIMIGSMIAVRDGTHFDVDLLPHPKTPFSLGMSKLVVHISMLAMTYIFIRFGYDFAKFGAQQESELAGVPMLSMYISFPLAGVSWLIFLAEKIIEDIKIMRGIQS